MYDLEGFTVLQVLGSLELKLSSYWGCWLGFETETRLQEFGLRVLVGFRVGVHGRVLVQRIVVLLGVSLSS